MYIGLYLLIPFLNLICSGLSSKKEKQQLILALIVMMALPQIINVYPVNDNGTAIEYQKVLPAWWVDFYPVMYYFLGCYLKEYPLQLKESAKLPLYVFSVVLTGTCCFFVSGGDICLGNVARPGVPIQCSPVCSAV